MGYYAIEFHLFGGLEIREITQRYNCTQLETSNKPYNLSLPKIRYRFKQGFILDIR